MKKLSIAFLILLGTISLASAELGLKVGLSGQIGEVDIDGTEQDIGPNATEKNKKSISALFATGSVFVEKNLGFLPGPLGRLSVGYDMVPHDLESGSASSLRCDETTRAGAVCSTDKKKNTVRVKIEDMRTLYATLRITDWLYFKGGSIEADLITEENLDTGGSYKNTDISGTIFGLGVETNNENNGTFMRFEVNQIEMDTPSVASTNTNNSVSLDVEGTTARISIGKSF